MTTQSYIDSQTMGMNEPDFVALIGRIVLCYCVVAEDIYGGLLVGYPGQSVLKQYLTQGKRPMIPDLQPEDIELREMLRTLGERAQKLNELDERMCKWVLNFTSMIDDSLLNGARRKRLRRRLVQYVEKAIEAGVFPPQWISEPEYLAFVEEAEQTVAAIKEARQEIEQRVQQLLASGEADQPSSRRYRYFPPIPKESVQSEDSVTQGSEFVPASTDEVSASIRDKLGDQRAGDLVDAAEAEPDPRQAIKLLHRALRYGKTGIFASAAYHNLGMKYETLGNYKKAVEYYTKSMDAWRPTAYTCFWRGRTYYRLGERAKAQVDLKQALSFPSSEGLYSPEREEAERILSLLSEKADSG